MKRSFERESSPYNKRNRDSSDGNKNDNYNRNSPYDDKKRYEDQREYYKSLCVRNLHSKLTNDDIENILNQEYGQFGEFNVKVTQFNGERVAYLNFKYSESARAARYEKPKPIICDRQCTVDPVLGSKSRYGPGGFDDCERVFRRALSPRMPSRIDSDKKDKFPHHLYHIEPEDDPKATRTLFVGNLSSEIEDSDLRVFFSKYGVIEDIDIKRPAKGTNNNSYAFVKYANLDMAHKAKVHMSGKVVRGFQCKIGYGKVTPTKCLWVGGLGPWVQYDLLEKVFATFGTIVDIDWPLNKNYAYILFDNVEAAIAACDKLRGYPLGDRERRIKVDFSDEAHVHNDPAALSGVWETEIVGTNQVASNTHNNIRPGRVGEISLICGDTYRFSSVQHANVTSLTDNSSKSSNTNDNNNEGNKKNNSEMTLEKSTMVLEMIKCMQHIWTGRFFLKSNYFGGRLYYLRGEKQMVEHFMEPKFPISNTQLKIEKKLILDNPSLDDVYLKITSGGDEGICIMLAVSENLDALNEKEMSSILSASTTYSEVDKENQKKVNEHDNANNEKISDSDNQKDNKDSHSKPNKKELIKRHLKALSAYLRIKQSAGKIILEGNTDDATGFGALHIFPPCSFSHKLLVDSSPLLTSDYGRDDFLLLILIRCY